MSKKREDLIGNRYGKLIVIDLFSINPIKWKCLCECGKESICYGSNLKQGRTKSCGCMEAPPRKYDLTGLRIGKLIIDKISRHEGCYTYWSCKCDCGKTTEYLTGSLIKGNLISCGCYRERKGNQHRDWKGCGELSQTFFNNIKKHANRRKIEFSINIEYLWNLYLTQNRLCALSKLPIDLIKPLKENRTASLDRIDSNQGYIEGNLQWVHQDINFMKYKFSQEHFYYLCDLITKNKDK